MIKNLRVFLKGVDGEPGAQAEANARRGSGWTLGLLPRNDSSQHPASTPGPGRGSVDRGIEARHCLAHRLILGSGSQPTGRMHGLRYWVGFVRFGSPGWLQGNLERLRQEPALIVT